MRSTPACADADNTMHEAGGDVALGYTEESDRESSLVEDAMGVKSDATEQLWYEPGS